MPIASRFDLARTSVESIAAMLSRVEDSTATVEDETVLSQFEDMVRGLAEDDDDPRIRRAILDAAHEEMDRQGGERLRPDLRVITGEGGA